MCWAPTGAAPELLRNACAFCARLGQAWAEGRRHCFRRGGSAKPLGHRRGTAGRGGTHPFPGPSALPWAPWLPVPEPRACSRDLRGPWREQSVLEGVYSPTYCIPTEPGLGQGKAHPTLWRDRVPSDSPPRPVPKLEIPRLPAMEGEWGPVALTTQACPTVGGLVPSSSRSVEWQGVLGPPGKHFQKAAGSASITPLPCPPAGPSGVLR